MAFDEMIFKAIFGSHAGVGQTLVLPRCRCGAYTWGEGHLCGTCADIHDWAVENRYFCNGLHRGVWV